MNQNRVLASIIVPMFNSEKFVSATLRSILNEKTTPIEVIVVNDRSSDRSLDRVREFRDERIRVIEGPGRGAPGAMNAGYAEAQGSIVMCCDSDDLYPGTRIREQIGFLNSHPEYGGVCGAFSTIDDGGNPVARMECGDSPTEITSELKNGKLRTSFCTYAIRTSLREQIGWFREFFEAGYDIDFQLRLGECERIAYVPENWYFYRIHASSITHTQSSLIRNFYEKTAIELQSQRRSSGLDELQRGNPPKKPDTEPPQVHSASDHIQGQLVGRAWREHQNGKKWTALRTGLRALMVRPLNIQVWKSILALAIKRSSTSAL